MNWYLSRPARELAQNLLSEPTRRIDIPHKDIPIYVFPKDDKTYTGSYDESHQGEFMEVAAKKIRKLLR